MEAVFKALPAPCASGTVSCWSHIILSWKSKMAEASMEWYKTTVKISKISQIERMYKAEINVLFKLSLIQNNGSIPYLQLSLDLNQHF